MTPVRTRLHRSGPISLKNKKNKFPLPHMLTCSAPKQCGRSDLPPRSPTARSWGCRVVPFTHRRSHRVSSHSTPLTCIPVIFAARSLVIHLLPIVIDTPLTPHGRWGAHVVARLRSSLAEPRAPTSMAAAARRWIPPRWSESTDPTFPSPIMQMYVSSVSDILEVYCNCYICMLPK
jgi:hypothetical protein